MADKFDIPDFSKQAPKSTSNLEPESAKQVEGILMLAQTSIVLGILIAPIGVLLAAIALTKVSTLENKLKVHKLSALEQKLASAKTCAMCGLGIGIFIMMFGVFFRLQFMRH